MEIGGGSSRECDLPREEAVSPAIAAAAEREGRMQ